MWTDVRVWSMFARECTFVRVMTILFEHNVVLFYICTNWYVQIPYIFKYYEYAYVYLYVNYAYVYLYVNYAYVYLYILCIVKYDAFVRTLEQEDAAECFTFILMVYNDRCKQQIEGKIITFIIMKTILIRCVMCLVTIVNSIKQMSYDVWYSFFKNVSCIFLNLQATDCM